MNYRLIRNPHCIIDECSCDLLRPNFRTSFINWFFISALIPCAMAGVMCNVLGTVLKEDASEALRSSIDTLQFFVPLPSVWFPGLWIKPSFRRLAKLSDRRSNGLAGTRSPAIFIRSGTAGFDKRLSGGSGPFSIFSSGTSWMPVVSRNPIKTFSCKVGASYQLQFLEFLNFEEIIDFRSQENLSDKIWGLLSWA